MKKNRFMDQIKSKRKSKYKKELLKFTLIQLHLYIHKLSNYTILIFLIHRILIMTD
jgi:hypothetical protein